ncbi:sulfurtransferase [Allosediminivita pacifica]|uniref:Thiosulfate/3-mercaptopyruvate sulfurtransferase n=1 Tax=Allosediminivita pacifica TaxID=1267769 RepID=A0A2T6AD66_9RHOB|nr:rhodanese-like domain-containing protein [Allosediminivita pacifica]PTX41759.1 thiosulfate/3-mercaptopyruvate sulfurtransferase [Allosediminivita pacifica]GGB22747.1 thiosulfate sulfurtransferase [Allosediminivita pacifica]
MTVTISATELADRLHEPGLVLVDTRTHEAWAEDTLPGAIFLNVYDYFVPESTDAGYEGMAAGAMEAFRRTGLDKATTIVWFEEGTGMRSPRGLWFQELLGLEGGVILDGGLRAWREIGGKTRPGDSQADAITHVDGPAPEGWQPELAVIRDKLLSPPSDLQIFDVRRPAEFDGSFKHDCCARGGRVPGAFFMFYEDMIRNGRYRPADEIREAAITAGLAPEKPVVTYCHRGARAATALYGLRLAGFRKVGIFVGSWHEWATDPELPMQTGPAI